MRLITLLAPCFALIAAHALAAEGRLHQLEAGGEELVLVPCLNDHPRWVEALKTLCERAPQQL